MSLSNHYGYCQNYFHIEAIEKNHGGVINWKNLLMQKLTNGVLVTPAPDLVKSESQEIWYQNYCIALESDRPLDSIVVETYVECQSE